VDPFSITCTTCKTRLKVRDESAIGQILACPKCGGLVMVKVPTDPTNSPSDSAETRPDISSYQHRPVTPYRPGDTLPATNFEDIDSILSDAPPRPRDPVPGGGGSKKARVSINDAAGQSALSLGGAAGVRKQAGRSPDVRDVPPPAPSASSSTVLPHSPAVGEGSSLDGSKSGSRIAIGPKSAIAKDRAVAPTAEAPVANSTAPTAASGGSAILLANASATPTPASTSPYPFAGETATPPPPPPVVAAHSWWHWPLITAAIGAGMLLAVGVVIASFSLLTHGPVQTARNPPSESSADTTKPAAPAADSPGDAATTEDVAPSAETRTPPTSAVVDAKTPEQPPESIAADDAKSPSAAVATNEAPVPTTTDKPIEEPAGEDPLGLVPRPPADTSKTSPTKLGDPLGGFANLIDAPTADPIPLEQASMGAAAEVPPEDSADGSASRPVLPRPQQRRVDVTARLADPLPAIDVSGVPLADFLHFVQDLSTIPVTLEPDALWFARTTAASPVNTKGQNLSVGDALAGGLKPLGLEYIIVDGQLTIGLIEPSPLPKIQYPVKDLARGDEQRAAELGEWMQSLVQPQSWGEGLGSLTVAKDTIATQQRREVHAELLSMFEKLRVARSQKPISRYDRANFALETRLARAKAKLDTPITLNFSQPALLTKIVSRLEDVAQVKILIDWQSLASVGWNPDGESSLLAENLPLTDALTKLLDPMELTWRAVDAGTIQILGPQAAMARLDLEFYPLPAPLSASATADNGESLLARLRTALGEEMFRESGGRCDLRYDAESKHLLASLPQSGQKKLATTLAELAAGAIAPSAK
jgi:DNA-directed RNA polymerase subunit RPC12/RpoP